MKIFDRNFFVGSSVVLFGLFCIIIAIALITLPTNRILGGICVLIIGLISAKYGYKIAKDAPLIVQKLKLKS